MTKARLVWTSLIALLTTLFLAIWVWRMEISFMGASIAKGTLVAGDILLIIFGALFFLETLKSSGTIENLCAYLKKISPDYRIQVILLAWFLEGFLEGTAGFGTPAVVVVPLLMGVGLSPIMAVAVALLGNSTSVVFGAAGTPIRVGFEGLEVSSIPFLAAQINLVGILVPVFMLWLITSKQKERRKHFVEGLPFALFAGIAFVVPSVFLTFLGQEFPSIVGSMVGFLIVLLGIKLRILIPDKIRTLGETKQDVVKISMVRTTFPYLILVGLLIVGKYSLGNSGIDINFGINHKLNFFNPGTAFLLASIPTIIFGRGRRKIAESIEKSASNSLEPFLIIAMISIMVQVMTHSGRNLSGNQSFLEIIASNFETNLLPMIAPFIGAFGSFLTGSATVSNIMFGNILQKASVTMGLEVAVILSMQLVGAAAGNMIALADILPALAVVWQKGKEREVIKRVAIPCLIYVTLVGIIGMLIARY